MISGYLRRLGIDQALPPTLESLRLIHRRHQAAVPYENLGIMLGPAPSVDPAASLERVGSVGRAGYCLHQNATLELVLQDLGFDVERGTATSGPTLPTATTPTSTTWCSWSRGCRPTTTRRSLVAGRRPGEGFLEPLPLMVGEYADGPFCYRIDTITDDGWSYTNDPSGSFSGLEVTRRPTDPMAVLEAHAVLSTPPDGHFARILVIQRRDESGLDTVRGCVHVRVDATGRHSTDLTTYDEWRAALVAIGVSLEGVRTTSCTRCGSARGRAMRPGWRRAGHSLSMSDDLLAIADELYALPLADFTPARDAKAKELKGTDLAPKVKALKKPSLAAWVVDLLARREADQVEQVLTVGAALREAQATMSGDSLRELTKQRRQLTAAVTQQARSLALGSRGEADPVGGRPGRGDAHRGDGRRGVRFGCSERAARGRAVGDRGG